MTVLKHQEYDLKLDEYQNIALILEKHPQFTRNQLYWIAQHRNRYELSHAIKKIGKRLYFHLPSLLIWIDQQNA